MNMKQALTEARKRWGKTAAVRDEGPKRASSPEKRALASAAFKSLRDQCATPELRKANRKELDRLCFEATQYRYSVGRVELGMFFSVKACGDTLQDCFDAATKKNNEGTAYA